MKNIKLSVHQLVDFLLRTGDIDNRIFNKTTMQEGTLLHSLYQSKQGPNYISEHPFNYDFKIGDITITLIGRADGIIKQGDDYIIDEIKTTIADLKEFRDENISWHLGQAKCYAYMFAKENNLEIIGVRLTYIKQGNIKEKLFDNYLYQVDKIENEIYDLLNEYLAFQNINIEAVEKRNESLKTLSFPFKNFRKGQKELAKYTYAIAKNGGRLFVEAPTGIGKTMSTLFPYIKSLNENERAKIFYLTAKSSGKENAHKAYNILQKSGLKAKSIVVTSKDKICFSKGKACNPDECPFARGYYTKISSVLKHSLLSYDDFDYQRIVDIAKENHMCPFELELDISLYCDLIICDYNYVFDPISYMKRYFDEDCSAHLLLIDEAHNLVDRSKDMFSAIIDQESFEKCRKSLTKINNKKLKTSLAKIKKIFSFYEGLYEEVNNVIEYLTDEDYRVFKNFLDVYLDVSKNFPKDVTKELTEFYLLVNRFMRIYEYYDSRFILYIKKENKKYQICLSCLDASLFIKNMTSRVKGSVFFSATLSPSTYYLDTLGGDKKDDSFLHLKSPFSPSNFKVLIAPKVSIKYKDREKSYETVCDYINAFTANKVGNYLVFLPSYEYLKRLKEIHVPLENVNYYYQTNSMTDIDKEIFLKNFVPNPEKSNVGFAIIGGSFSEGIDLVSDRLIGAIIIGIGMPKINFESDMSAKLFDENELPGRDYAYIYPGMNKVMQAVGRVIRSEDDKGMVLLIDDRYLTNKYRSLIKSEWSNYNVVYDTNDIKYEVLNFYK